VSFICGDLSSVTCDEHRFAMLHLKPKLKSQNLKIKLLTSPITTQGSFVKLRPANKSPIPPKLKYETLLYNSAELSLFRIS